MPGIIATYGDIEVVGVNRVDRPHNAPNPFIQINGKAHELAAYLDNCTKPLDRSFYSCAEAQALALLLQRVGSTIDFRKIEFRRPSSDYGYMLWEPCENCQLWMEEKGGWGPDKTYKIREDVLNRLCPKVVTKK